MKTKRWVMMAILAAWFLAACGPKPYYKTSEGKKKQKYYNDIQFGGKSASELRKQ
jgi:ABC-type oligopeptide transport system substrate-binding subunit